MQFPWVLWHSPASIIWGNGYWVYLIIGEPSLEITGFVQVGKMYCTNQSDSSCANPAVGEFNLPSLMYSLPLTPSRYANIDLKTQEAYELAVKGLIRPMEKSPPLITAVRSLQFAPPEFQLGMARDVFQIPRQISILFYFLNWDIYSFRGRKDQEASAKRDVCPRDQKAADSSRQRILTHMDKWCRSFSQQPPHS